MWIEKGNDMGMGKNIEKVNGTRPETNLPSRFQPTIATRRRYKGGKGQLLGQGGLDGWVFYMDWRILLVSFPWEESASRENFSARYALIQDNATAWLSRREDNVRDARGWFYLFSDSESCDGRRTPSYDEFAGV